MAFIGGGSVGVTTVSGTAPIASSGGSTPTISLNDTAVTPAAYTKANITVDQKGRITAAADGSAQSSIGFGWWGSVTLNPSATYYYSNAAYDGPTGSDTNFARMPVGVSGTITGFYLQLYVSGTPQNGAASFTVMKNGVASSIVISPTNMETTSSPAVLSDEAHTLAISAGDQISLKIVTPNWGGDATGVRAMFALRVIT